MKFNPRIAARLAVMPVAVAGLGILGATSASAATCTPDPIADPNVGAYACFDAVIQDSDPTRPGAELNTTYFVDVDLYGSIRVCVGRVIVGGQVDVVYVQPRADYDPEPVRVCG